MSKKKVKRLSVVSLFSVFMVIFTILFFSPQEVYAGGGNCYTQVISGDADSCTATREVCPRRFLWITWWTDYSPWQFSDCPGGALSGD